MVCPGYVITTDRDDFVANLLVIPLSVFDVILGMDWLHRSRDVISCFCKMVSLETPSGHTLIFQVSAPPNSLFVLAKLFLDCRASLLVLGKLFLDYRAVKTRFLWTLAK